MRLLVLEDEPAFVALDHEVPEVQIMGGPDMDGVAVDPADPDAVAYLFGAPGLAIVRNAIVISLGFLPLVVSTLTPYVTVGCLFAGLMIAGAIATLFVLPALLRVLGPRALA